MRKYFFFDIDGTLTTPLTADYPESTREAVQKLMENGHFVAIATGRMQSDAARVAREPKMMSNTLPVSWMPLKVSVDACIRTLTEIDEEKHPFAFCPYNRKYRITRTTKYLEKVKDRYYETAIIPDFYIPAVDVIHKIFIACTKKEKDDIPLYTLPHVWFSADTMLVEPVHKERGIMEIQKMRHIPDEDIVVFGDGMNDRAMFRPEWMSIAMGNAKPELKALAKYITSRADEDGIYNACRHFGWI